MACEENEQAWHMYVATILRNIISETSETKQENSTALWHIPFEKIDSARTFAVVLLLFFLTSSNDRLWQSNGQPIILKTGLADVANEGLALSTVHLFPPEHPTWSFRSESLSIFLSRKSELKVHRCADDSLEGSGFLFAFGFLSSWMLVVRDFGLRLVVRCYSLLSFT
jgi:hypothetical protein